MTDELQTLADKVVAQAQAGEEIEAYVSRGGETEVRVYQGEVEHFVSAQSEGIGVRIIRDGRTGFAYAGTLEEAPSGFLVIRKTGPTPPGFPRRPGVARKRPLP